MEKEDKEKLNVKDGINKVIDELQKNNDNMIKLFEEYKSNGKSKKVRSKKLGKGNKKRGYVRYIYIDGNNNIKVTKVPIDESIIWYEKVPRLAEPTSVLSWDGDPTIIQPSWSVKPFSPKENYEDAVNDKMTAQGHRLLLKAIKEGEVKPKRKMSGVMIFFIIIALIVIGYLLLSG